MVKQNPNCKLLMIGKGEKEELIKEKEDLLKTAKELEIMDLRILYYVKNCSYVFRSTLLKCLKDLYDAERAYKKLLQKPNE